MFDIDMSLVEKSREKSMKLKQLLDTLRDVSLLDQHQALMIKKYSLDMSRARYEKNPCERYKEDLLLRLQDISD